MLSPSASPKTKVLGSSATERAQTIVDANDEERVKTYRVDWFHDNIHIVTNNREGLKEKLKELAGVESHLASDAYNLLATGNFDLDRIQDVEFLKFVIDSARDSNNADAREERHRNHFA